MKNLEGYPRVKDGGHNVQHLRYTDDNVLIPENKENMRQFLDILEEESRKKELEMIRKKIEVMVVNKSTECPQITIFLIGIKLKQKGSIQRFGHFHIK